MSDLIKLLVIHAESEYYDDADPANITLNVKEIENYNQLFAQTPYHWGLQSAIAFELNSDKDNLIKQAVRAAGYTKASELERINKDIKWGDKFWIYNTRLLGGRRSLLVENLNHHDIDELASNPDVLLMHEVTPESVLNEEQMKRYRKEKLAAKKRKDIAAKAAKTKKAKSKQKEIEKAKKLLQEAGELK